MDVPETHYARRGDLQIAYQVAGEGPLDLVFVQPYLSNIELSWELPAFSSFYKRLSPFARLILFDRRGSGMSDGIAGATPRRPAREAGDRSPPTSPGPGFAPRRRTAE